MVRSEKASAKEGRRASLSAFDMSMILGSLKAGSPSEVESAVIELLSHESQKQWHVAIVQQGVVSALMSRLSPPEVKNSAGEGEEAPAVGKSENTSDKAEPDEAIALAVTRCLTALCAEAGPVRDTVCSRDNISRLTDLIRVPRLSSLANDLLSSLIFSSSSTIDIIVDENENCTIGKRLAEAIVSTLKQGVEKGDAETEGSGESDDEPNPILALCSKTMRLALFACRSQKIRSTLVSAGIVPLLVSFIVSEETVVAKTAAQLLCRFASGDAIIPLPETQVTRLVQIVCSGTLDTQESALSVLAQFAETGKVMSGTLETVGVMPILLGLLEDANVYPENEVDNAAGAKDSGVTQAKGPEELKAHVKESEENDGANEAMGMHTVMAHAFGLGESEEKASPNDSEGADDNAATVEKISRPVSGGESAAVLSCALRIMAAQFRSSSTGDIHKLLQTEPKLMEIILQLAIPQKSVSNESAGEPKVVPGAPEVDAEVDAPPPHEEEGESPQTEHSCTFRESIHVRQQAVAVMRALITDDEFRKSFLANDTWLPSLVTEVKHDPSISKFDLEAFQLFSDLAMSGGGAAVSKLKAHGVLEALKSAAAAKPTGIGKTVLASALFCFTVDDLIPPYKPPEDTTKPPPPPVPKTRYEFDALGSSRNEELLLL